MVIIRGRPGQAGHLDANYRRVPGPSRFGRWPAVSTVAHASGWAPILLWGFAYYPQGTPRSGHEICGEPACQPRRVLETGLRLLCRRDLSPHGRPQTVVNSRGATQMSAVTTVRAPTHCCLADVRRRVAACILTAAEVTSRDLMLGHAHGQPGKPSDSLQYCSRYCITAMLEKGRSCSRGRQFRCAHRLPACCNCLR